MKGIDGEEETDASDSLDKYGQKPWFNKDFAENVKLNLFCF